MPKQKIPVIPDLCEDAKRFVEDLQNETDRGVALAAAAFLGDILGALLQAVFIDKRNVVDEILNQGCASSFAARTKLAYCLGLLGTKMYEDLNVIRKIRNEFSHSHHPASFDEPGIRDLCDQLKLVSILPPLPVLPVPRYRFIIDAVLLANQIMMRGLRLNHATVGKDTKLAGHVKVDNGPKPNDCNNKRR